MLLAKQIQLGFTPKAVLVAKTVYLAGDTKIITPKGWRLMDIQPQRPIANVVSVVEGGFQVFDGTKANYNGRTNVASQKYYI